MTINKYKMLIQLGILWHKHEHFSKLLAMIMTTIWNCKPALILHNSNTHLLILLKELNPDI